MLFVFNYYTEIVSMERFRQHKGLIDNFLVDIGTVLVNLVGVINCRVDNCLTAPHFRMFAHTMIIPRPIIAHNSYAIFVKTINDVHAVLWSMKLRFVNSSNG